MSHRVAYHRHRRRGMLLLMVMLMLSLFMAIGAMLLTIAARARAAARANLSTIQSSSSTDTIYRDALEEALLAALRGATSGTNGSVTITGSTAPVLENLLADKYGLPITGTGSITSGTNSPVITLTLTGLSSSGTPPSRLNGRILTINPRSGAGEISSYRILGATGTTGTTTCFIAQMPSTVSRQLPSGNFDVVINGREFTPVSAAIGPEPYDAYDDANLWLAQPLLSLGQVSQFDRLSFSGTAAAAVVDNDNDGVPDGIWLPSDTVLSNARAAGTSTPLPLVLPDRPSPLGGTLRFQVSYLILDLDGRININAAGMARPETGSYGAMEVPLGMGYGPADIDASLLFPATPPSVTGTSAFINTGTSGTTTWASVLYGGSSSGTAVPPSAVQRRSPPLIGGVDGKYGANDSPGIAGDDSGPYQITLNSASGTSVNYAAIIAGTNSFADLQARKKIFMSGTTGQITPVMNIFSVTPIASATAAISLDSTDDPYELRLDAEAPRPAVTSQTGAAAIPPNRNDDNPYTLAELERILRANDPDAIQLPQRAAAGLRDFSQRSRMTVTTDSWDTPAVTGLAGRRMEEQLASVILPLQYSSSAWARSSGINAVSPDVAAGLRFNINRPIISDGNPDNESPDEQTDKQNYCKGLYTLVMLLGAPDSVSAAQWAANVMDFRDPDNLPTRFEYDTNLADGWNPPGGTQVVWGVERPEVLITEVAARRDNNSSPSNSEVYVVLHRVPHNTLPNLWSSANVLLNDPSNSYRIQLTSPSGTATYPLTGTLASTGSSAYLCVSTATPLTPINFSVANTGTLTIPNFSFPRDPNTGIIAATGTISLQRIVNSGTFTVDRAVIPNISEITSNPSPNKLRRRGPADVDTGPSKPPTQSDWMTAFWNPVWLTTGSNPKILGPYVSGTAYTSNPARTTDKYPVSWFHWPNRPFISQAELLLVPTNTTGGVDVASQMLANYSFPYLQESGSTTPPNAFHSLASSTNSITIGGTSAPLGSLILEATYVPSRFAGNTLTVSGSGPELLGFNTLSISGSTIATSGSFGEISKWREPGKINVNTIVSGTTIRTGTTPLVDEVVWTTFLGSNFPSNPFLPRPQIDLPRTAIPAVPASRGNPTIPAVPAIPNNPTERGIQPAKPADSLAKMLFLLSGTNAALLSGTAPLDTATPLADHTTPPGDDLYPRDRNPFFAYAQAIRLANTATIRSQVFAVWITVRITDDSPNAPSPVTKRMFAIIDRSIPVGYAPGQDLNVRDTIRLKRFLD